jgi:uncharacterized integral membrane protein (TIGR00698 family)
MNVMEVVRVGRDGFVYTAVSIGTAMIIGLWLGRIFKVRPKAAFLISAGTAICGGSAIAALAPITNPDKDELATSMGTIFRFNAIALFVFPVIGTAMHLSQNQFGLWSALAIHDTSSVVGAAAKFGPSALRVATIVKLTRALWILPLALLTTVLTRTKASIRFPWFIAFFCLAALANSYLPHLAPLFQRLTKTGHMGLALSLFLIGSSINRRILQQTGSRVILQGLVLWLAMAATSLFSIAAGWIS